MDRHENSESSGPPGIGSEKATASNSTPIPTPLPASEASVSLSSAVDVVARFEFETGRGNEGTKVLLVEWESGPDEPPPDNCEVEWEGKTEVLAVTDRRAITASSRQRLLFWLPPTASVPPTISITRPGRAVLHAKPLPAIFAPGLGPAVPDAGRRGVLHTLWASLKMAVLDDEISREAKENTESVGLGMALQEKDFILEHFGIGDPNHTTGGHDSKAAAGPVLPPLATAQSEPSPIHPDTRSPVSVRMAEKLKGLKLATSPEGLAAAATGKNQPNAYLAPMTLSNSNPLLPLLLLVQRSKRNQNLRQWVQFRDSFPS
ncbi:hypothetical protein MKZ38_006469 [Zalerion maritima]|uniref:Uncharacterized protein n=1 Tax=Zalerion maritima TaxID=339359 RepID=A0AAD5RWH7_9PEZI|nr:hypothetical protein MKZ38_006469 [Zalerion maritima]